MRGLSTTCRQIPLSRRKRLPIGVMDNPQVERYQASRNQKSPKTHTRLGTSLFLGLSPLALLVKLSIVASYYGQLGFDRRMRLILVERYVLWAEVVD